MADRFAAKAAAKPLHSRVCEKRAIWCAAARVYPVGLCKVPLFRQVRTRRALPAVSPGATGSNEGESQKAGAKKGKSRRGQGKKAIGNEVLISHHTPSDLDARWNLLKLSERASSKQAIHASAQVKPVNGFRQTHGPGRLRRRPNPSLPSLSQTLPTFLCAPARQKTAATLHSQKDFRGANTHPDRSRILRNRCYRFRQ